MHIVYYAFCIAIFGYKKKVGKQAGLSTLAMMFAKFLILGTSSTDKFGAFV